MTVLTSVELNYLVFRYLQESGFTHAAFTFGYEAGIDKCPIDANIVPPGSLVTFIQRGLQYVEMEVNLKNCDADLEGDFSFLQPMDLITKDVGELRKMVSDQKKNIRRERKKEFGKDPEGERSTRDRNIHKGKRSTRDRNIHKRRSM